MAHTLANTSRISRAGANMPNLFMLRGQSKPKQHGIRHVGDHADLVQWLAQVRLEAQ